MGQFEERELKYLHTCWGCKHYCVDTNGEDEGYCLLGLSKEEKDHIWESFMEFNWDDKTYELLKMPVNGDYYDSLRMVEPETVCQFWERPKYEPEEEQDE